MKAKHTLHPPLTVACLTVGLCRTLLRRGLAPAETRESSGRKHQPPGDGGDFRGASKITDRRAHMKPREVGWGFTPSWLIAGAALTLVSACTSRSGATPPPGHDEHGMMHMMMHMHAAAGAGGVDADEQAAYERARPVFEKFCFKCHTTGGARSKPKALKHLNMDTYPLAGHHTAEIGAAVREALGVTGEEPTMPGDDPGIVKGDDLAVVLAWADAFDKARKNAAPESHEHGGGGQPADDAGNIRDGRHDEHDHMHHQH